MEALVDLIRFADERPSLVSPIAGTWTLPTDCAAALQGVGVRPSRSSSDRTGNQAAGEVGHWFSFAGRSDGLSPPGFPTRCL